MLPGLDARRDAGMELMEMTRGGARNRSGPAPDPSSGRSDRRGLSFQALPNEGYQGRAPRFPLAALPERHAELAKRERAVWREAWRTPQACVWAIESWRWPIVAEYCRLKASVELSPGENASTVAQLHRYRDQLGLTPAGLKENGWAIQTPDILAGAVTPDEEQAAPPSSSRARLKAVGG